MFRPNAIRLSRRQTDRSEREPRGRVSPSVYTRGSSGAGAIVLGGRYLGLSVPEPEPDLPRLP